MHWVLKTQFLLFSSLLVRSSSPPKHSQPAPFSLPLFLEGAPSLFPVPLTRESRSRITFANHAKTTDKNGDLALLHRGPARLLQRPRPGARPRRLLRRDAARSVLAAARHDLRLVRREGEGEEEPRRGGVDVVEIRDGDSFTSAASAAVVRGGARRRVPLGLRRGRAHKVSV